MKRITQFMIAGCMVIALVNCADVRPSSECALPPLSEADVKRIANDFLSHQDMNPEFRKIAEVRVKEAGCHYEYEEAQKLDSFGVGIIVEVDRRRRVVDFRGSH